VNLPPLDPERRAREYNSYDLAARGRVVRAWLFDGATTRAIDEEVLDRNSSYSRGYQSMGILHHLGLKKAYQGLFSGKTIDEVVARMREEGSSFARVVEHLLAGTDEPTIALATLQRIEAEEEQGARSERAEDRQRRIAAAPRTPDRIKVFSYAYKRNPDIVVEALLRAAGHCERCSKPAPFSRASDGTPYLEVHHVKSLADGGEDTLQNVLALCPNCHREIHHGMTSAREP
jgi:5-methylcytosine-specific restriction protein A